MKAFRFRLQSVLELREERELESARGLAQARAEAEAARRAREDLEAARDASRARLDLAHGSGGAAGHLRNLAFVVSRVDERIRQAQDACRVAEEQVVASMQHYRRAHIERKTLEGLREQRLDEWRAAEARHDQKTMDEVALTRHGRSESDPS